MFKKIIRVIFIIAKSMQQRTLEKEASCSTADRSGYVYTRNKYGRIEKTRKRRGI